jgi:putative nucleotidyltransferase with HDIG domain
MPEGYIALSGVGSSVEGLKWESQNLLRIGRQASLEVVVRDSSIDRLHAEIKFQGQRWMLKDLAKSEFYPTALNGRVLTGKSEHLKLNDLIQIGQVRFRVMALGAETVLEVPVALKASGLPQTEPMLTVAESGPDLSQERTPVPKTRPSEVVVTQVNRVAGLAEPLPPPGANGDLQVLQVQTSMRQSWDQAVEHAGTAIHQRDDGGRTISALLRANHHLSTHSSLEELLHGILSDILESLDSQRGAILLADPKTGELELKAVRAPSRFATGKKGYSRTLAERSFRQGESLLCRDVRRDQEVFTRRSVLFGSMSSIICAVLRTPRRKLGVLHLDRGPLQEPFTENDLYLADAVAASIAVGIECAQLVAGQSDQFLETATMLARAVEMRDQYTGDHTKRVTEYALMIADQLNFGPVERSHIRVGTPLHDIGKIGVDDAVLRKPGKLTDAEFEHMKSHTLKGAAMLDGFAALSPVVPIVRSHHERWDGTGYPDRASRDRIALAARVVAVADAFDAMTSNRPYRPAMPTQLAFLELISEAGTHFDPGVVQAFVSQRATIEAIVRGRVGA